MKCYLCAMITSCQYQRLRLWVLPIALLLFWQGVSYRPLASLPSKYSPQELYAAPGAGIIAQGNRLPTFTGKSLDFSGIKKLKDKDFGLQSDLLETSLTGIMPGFGVLFAFQHFNRRSIVFLLLFPFHTFR